MKATAFKNKLYGRSSDRRVEQIGNVLTNADYEILLSGTANDDYYIGETRKTASLTYNPSTKKLKIDGADIAMSATTLAGYGITDAKIVNGTITLGSNSITPLTSHQDISGKVNKSGDTMTGGLTCSTSGANLSWGNITVYGGGSNGGLNSMLVGDDVTLGDCNVSGMLGLKSTVGNCGIRLYNSSGNLIGGFQSTAGTPQWIDSSNTASDIALTSYVDGCLAGATAGSNGDGSIIFAYKGGGIFLVSTIKKSSTTINSFLSNTVSGDIYLVKWGNIVVCTGLVRVSQATVTLDICNIPSGYVPGIHHWLSSDYYGDTSGCEFRAKSTGKIDCSIPSGSAGKDIKLCGVWIL